MDVQIFERMLERQEEERLRQIEEAKRLEIIEAKKAELNKNLFTDLSASFDHMVELFNQILEKRNRISRITHKYISDRNSDRFIFNIIQNDSKHLLVTLEFLRNASHETWIYGTEEYNSRRILKRYDENYEKLLFVPLNSKISKRPVKNIDYLLPDQKAVNLVDFTKEIVVDEISKIRFVK